jgi:hypothetical protein
MMLESGLTVFCAGLSGGAANELLHWWGLRENPLLPEYAKQLRYWTVTVLMMVLGGVLASIQLGSRADALIAFQIGLAAPLILQKLVKTAPQQAGAMGSALPTIRSFLAG